MFDAGFIELMFIALVALVVVGPERLPKVAAEAGKWLGKLRRFIAQTKSEIQQEFDGTELQSMLNKQEEEINKLKNMLSDSQMQVSGNVQQEFDEMNQALVDADRYQPFQNDKEEAASQFDSKTMSDYSTEVVKENAQITDDVDTDSLQRPFSSSAVEAKDTPPAATDVTKKNK